MPAIPKRTRSRPPQTTQLASRAPAAGAALAIALLLATVAEYRARSAGARGE